MTVQLTTKERMLLQDQKSQEELCVQKYQSYSGLAQDPQLKQLFSSLAQKEQEHLNSVNQILSGQIPSTGTQSGGQSQQSMQSGGQSQQSMQPGGRSHLAAHAGMPSMAESLLSGSAIRPSSGSTGQAGQTTGGMQSGQSGMFSDKELCSDMLATEKFVSGTYDMAIFECTNTGIRQVLNHIQKEEQEHGEQIFNYMQSHGMYSVQ